MPLGALISPLALTINQGGNMNSNPKQYTALTKGGSPIISWIAHNRRDACENLYKQLNRDGRRGSYEMWVAGGCRVLNQSTGEFFNAGQTKITINIDAIALREMRRALESELELEFKNDASAIFHLLVTGAEANGLDLDTASELFNNVSE
jgi:hypothetical protein